jgi:hypothetical protein
MRMPIRYDRYSMNYQPENRPPDRVKPLFIRTVIRLALAWGVLTGRYDVLYWS